MKSYKVFYIFLILLLSGFSSCVKKLAPSEIKAKSDDKYDLASFNYIYTEALKQKLMGNGGDALRDLEQAIKINPESDAAYYQMAQIVIANGDINNGKKYALKALSFDQKNLWYLTMLAGLYYQEKNIDSSIIYYDRAVKFYPEKENLQLTLGNLYSEQKSFDKANAIFEAFDNKYGINERSTLSAIKNLMAEGKFEQALGKTQTLIKEFPEELLYIGILAEIYKNKGDNTKAREVYNDLLTKEPEDPQVQLSLADFLIRDKNYNDLFELLNVIILNSKVQRESKISLVAQIIEIQELSNEFKDKLLISLMVLEANYAGDHIVPLLRPDFLIKLNKLDDAALRLEEIVKTDQQNYYAWEKLLFIYLQQKDFNKLLSRGEECARLFNTSYTAKLLYANGALETGKYPTALEELKKAEILASDNKEYMLQVLTMRADAYYRMKDFAKAFETFELALKNNNDDLTVMNNYAYYLAEQNTKLKEAEEMAKSVTEKDKTNTTFLDTYGWVLYKRGKLKEAAKVMETIINSGDKPDAVWYEHYGYILKKEKKCDQAIANWNIALKLDSTKTELLKEIENCGK
jgi:tetratricopeptide (TPR) repeat protein